MPQPAPAAMKPVILADHYPISAMISVGPADFCLKKTRPTLGSSSAADKASATCYLVEQLQYLYGCMCEWCASTAWQPDLRARLWQ
jgi:hypothetical protein